MVNTQTKLKQALKEEVIMPESSLGEATEGIFLVDKPSGVTSHDVVDKVRKITGLKRVGHTGTLDPLASGLLIILVGRQFTKKQAEFMKLDKEYQCSVRLGFITDTYDIEGQVIEESDWDKVDKIKQDDLEKLLPKFIGKIQQTVPAYSAIKREGKKLYELARSGELDWSTLPTREIEIYNLKITNFRKDQENKTLEFDFNTKVSSGTYIRSLAFDLGKELGVGGTVVKLRRTSIGEHKL